jgi:signal transduction histidine kinase
MFTRWVERVFDERYRYVRLMLLALSGIGYLTLQQDPRDPMNTADWIFALGAIALCPAVAKWPLPGAIAQAFMLFGAATFGQADPVVPLVGSSLSLVELALREPGRRALAGAGVLTGLYLVDIVRESSLAELPNWLYRMLISIGVPLLLGINIRAARRLAQQADERAATAQRTARAAERADIARELHDLVAHHVASMVLRVGVARHVLRDTDPRVTEVFDDLHSSGTAALTDLRQLVSVLRDPATVGGYLPVEPGTLPGELTAAVDRATQTGLTVDARIDPGLGTLDAVRGLAVLRLTQEGLSNVARHAGPTATAQLTIAMEEGRVQWEITDDGNGTPVAAPADPGHGLTGMRERVEVLGGTLEAGPFGTGWRVRTVLP